MGESTVVEEVDGVVLEEYESKQKPNHNRHTLFGVLQSLLGAIVSPDLSTAPASAPPLQRIRTAFSDHAPLLRDATHNTAGDLLRWARAGSPLRGLLLISVGTSCVLGMTGVLLFTLFFVAATINAIIICFLISLALLGGFLAFFFACVTAIYIGAISIAMFVISAMTISAIIAVVVATGWIGFFLAVWYVTKKTMSLVKHSFGLTTTKDPTFSTSLKHVKGEFAE